MEGHDNRANTEGRDNAVEGRDNRVNTEGRNNAVEGRDNRVNIVKARVNTVECHIKHGEGRKIKFAQAQHPKATLLQEVQLGVLLDLRYPVLVKIDEITLLQKWGEQKHLPTNGANIREFDHN